MSSFVGRFGPFLPLLGWLIGFVGSFPSFAPKRMVELFADSLAGTGNILTAALGLILVALAVAVILGRRRGEIPRPNLALLCWGLSAFAVWRLTIEMLFDANHRTGLEAGLIADNLVVPAALGGAVLLTLRRSATPAELDGDTDSDDDDVDQ